ncbi:HIT family protein [Amycolatopsis sp.]|jgi:histidine triad (HIT) family protein|uniref:HIT family protein n=1 Tax=Amycolatopsis sp. TaxID=37632 RepID=UPI002E051CAF|nr:HIT domain-containing protein [Amycolatopsis sp.]
MTSTPSAAVCSFCEIVAERASAQVVRRWDDVLAIRPRSGGVADGHVLVIPHQCVPDIGADTALSARVMECVAELAAELPACNIITSKGATATQTVFHLHVHVVPRAAGDNLPLPWSTQGSRLDGDRG